MDIVETDIVVIGMGPGGEDAAGRLAEAGLHVTGVEARLVGGECPYWGCVPSKMMIRAVGLLAEARRIPGMASASTVSPDWEPVARRIRGHPACCSACSLPRRGHRHSGCQDSAAALPVDSARSPAGLARCLWRGVMNAGQEAHRRPGPPGGRCGRRTRRRTGRRPAGWPVTRWGRRARSGRAARWTCRCAWPAPSRGSSPRRGRPRSSRPAPARPGGSQHPAPAGDDLDEALGAARGHRPVGLAHRQPGRERRHERPLPAPR